MASIEAAISKMADDINDQIEADGGTERVEMDLVETTVNCNEAVLTVKYTIHA